MHKSLSLITQLLFLFIVIATIGIVVVSKNKILFGWQLLTVRSGSMAPTIPTGSVVFIQQKDSYTVGDIVSYTDPKTSALITHRIIEKKDENLTLRGDANPSADLTPIPTSAVSGKAITYLPLAGYFLAFLQTPVGVTSFIVIPGAILVYEELRALRKNIKSVFSKKSAVIIPLLFLAIAFSTSATSAAYTTSNTKITSLSFETIAWDGPQANVSKQENALRIHTTNVGGITDISYVVRYSHTVEEETVQEQVSRSHSKDPGLTEYTLPDLLIGMCSADACVPHTGVTEMSVEVTFKQGSTIVSTVTTPFSF